MRLERAKKENMSALPSAECVTAPSYLSEIVTIQPNEMKILVKVELLYILLH